MSYTTLEGHPYDLKIACNPSGNIEIAFSCPRCGMPNYHEIDPMDMAYEVVLTCNHNRCMRPGESYGYRLTFNATWKGSILGELDRQVRSWEGNREQRQTP